MAKAQPTDPAIQSVARHDRNRSSRTDAASGLWFTKTKHRRFQRFPALCGETRASHPTL